MTGLWEHCGKQLSDLPGLVKAVVEPVSKDCNAVDPDDGVDGLLKLAT